MKKKTKEKKGTAQPVLQHGPQTKNKKDPPPSLKLFKADLLVEISKIFDAAKKAGIDPRACVVKAWGDRGKIVLQQKSPTAPVSPSSSSSSFSSAAAASSSASSSSSSASSAEAFFSPSSLLPPQREKTLLEEMGAEVADYNSQKSTAVKALYIASKDPQTVISYDVRQDELSQNQSHRTNVVNFCLICLAVSFN